MRKETGLIWLRVSFLSLFLLLVYVWMGYPILLFLLRRFRRSTLSNPLDQPFISIILPVHNEQSRIADKLTDCLQLDYPCGKLEIIVISDHSTDRTEQIVEEVARTVPNLRLLRTEGRAGKSGAQNVAVQHARGELIFFTDANTRVAKGALRLLVAAVSDPRVGLATATVYFGEPSDSVTRGQGLYWRYECFLRHAESDLGSLATASGQAILMRRELFRPMPPFYGDDCVLPLDVRLQGYRVVQEPNAFVFDTMPHSIVGELRVRIRMTARNWTGTLSRPGLLNPWRYPLTAWGLISHKLLRWFTPFMLLAMFALNSILVTHRLAQLLWGTQVLFYSFAWLGWLFARRQKSGGLLAYPFAFCLANVGFFFGILKGIRNQRIVAYEGQV